MVVYRANKIENLLFIFNIIVKINNNNESVCKKLKIKEFI